MEGGGGREGLWKGRSERVGSEGGAMEGVGVREGLWKGEEGGRGYGRGRSDRGAIEGMGVRECKRGEYAFYIINQSQVFKITVLVPVHV